MKTFRLKGLAELVDAIHALRESVDHLSHFAREIADQAEFPGPPCHDEDGPEPPHGPKKKRPKKKHPKKKRP